MVAGEQLDRRVHIITSRVAKRAKVMFSQASVCPTPGGLPSGQREGVCLNTYLSRPPLNTYLGRPSPRKADPPPPLPAKAEPPPPRRADAPCQGRPPPPGNTVNGRAVRILLECNLVSLLHPVLTTFMLVASKWSDACNASIQVPHQFSFRCITLEELFTQNNFTVFYHKTKHPFLMQHLSALSKITQMSSIAFVTSHFLSPIHSYSFNLQVLFSHHFLTFNQFVLYSCSHFIPQTNFPVFPQYLKHFP